jgi:hypothetical protein
VRRLSVSARERRTLWVGVVVIAVVVAVRTVPVVIGWSASNRVIAAEMGLEVAMAEYVIRNTAAVRDSIETRTARLIAHGALLLPANESAGGPDALARIVSGTAAAVDLQLVRLDIVPTEALTAESLTFAPARVRGEFTGDMGAVLGFVATLETIPPLLSITELGIWNAQPSGQASEPVRLNIVIEGLALRRRTGGDS